MNVKKIIANQAVQSDKTAWNRKYSNLQVLVERINELSDQVLVIEDQKIPIALEIHELRTQMLQECIHPQEYLVVVDGIATCKFCDNNFGISTGV